MVRVLYVLDHDEMCGGVVQAVETIVRNGRAHGVKAAVFVPHSKGETAIAMQNAGAEVFAFEKPFVYKKTKPIRSLRSLICFARRLKEVITTFKPDVIETNHATAETFTSFGQKIIRNTIPRVFCQRGNPVIYRGLSSSALRLALRSVNAVISVSPFPDEVYSQMLRIPSERLVCITDCVTSQEFQLDDSGRHESDALRKIWQCKPDDVLVGILGFISPNKNQAMLIESAREISRTIDHAKFILIGTCLSTQYYNQIVTKTTDYDLQDHVTFAGFVDKHKAIPALDIVVSLSHCEGFGLSILEAGVCGKPVIATQSGGPNYIIRDGVNGYLIPRDDVFMLAKCLTTLIDDPALRNTMGEAGKKIAKMEYDPDDKIISRIKLYERLCNYL